MDYLIEYFKYSYAVPLDDYTDDVARENMVFSTTMDFMPKEFMVISKIAYEHPTDRITKPNAGCGFIFHDNEIDKSYFAMITADSQARLFNLVLKEYIKGVAHHKIKQKPLTSPNGSAEVIVAVMDDRFVMAVDGEIVIDQAMTWDSEGKFGYSFSSGTNKGYGLAVFLLIPSSIPTILLSLIPIRVVDVDHKIQKSKALGKYFPEGLIYSRRFCLDGHNIKHSAISVQ